MKTILLLTSVLFTITFNAQTDPDQNPNYRKSMDKYMSMKDSSHVFMSSTIQEIYNVVDWAEEKQKRKDLKKARKHELKKMRIKANNQNRRYRYRRGYNPYNYNNNNYGNNGNYNNGNYNYYNNPSYGSYGYGNGYNYGVSNDLFILGSLLYLFH